MTHAAPFERCPPGGSGPTHQPQVPDNVTLPWLPSEGIAREEAEGSEVTVRAEGSQSGQRGHSQGRGQRSANKTQNFFFFKSGETKQVFGVVVEREREREREREGKIEREIEGRGNGKSD